MSPCLDDLVRDPARAGLLSSEERQALLAQAASVLVVLASSGVSGDRLLTVKEAAHKLGCAADTLYRNKRHPARVQNGRSVRFVTRPSRPSFASAGAALPEPLRPPNMDRLTLRNLRPIRLFSPPLACK